MVGEANYGINDLKMDDTFFAHKLIYEPILNFK